MDLNKHAYEWYRAKGYSDHAAAALAANMMAESGGNTRITHDGGTGVGIFGFRDPTPGKGRKTDLMNFAKIDPATGKPRETPLDPYALNTQLDFSHHELNTSEKAAGDRLRAAPDYRSAQVATIGYLRPHFYNSDPSKQTIPADRWNPGAAYVGADPMMGPTIAAAGGNNGPPVTPTGGILQPPPQPQYDPDSQDINERTRAADQLIASSQESQYDNPTNRAALARGEADAAKKQEDASKAFASQASSLGQSLMAQGAPKAAPKSEGLLQASVHQPKEMAAMPNMMGADFQQQIAQSRLGGGNARRRTPFDEEFG